MTLEKFKGNCFTPEEKEYRLQQLKKEILDGEVDEEMISYLEKINSYPFIVTTQSCCGHGEHSGRVAYIDFRSSLSPEEVINYLLKPLDKKFSPYIGFQLCGLDCDRLRYCIWLHNEMWKEQLEYFIQLLESYYKNHSEE